ncbi:hypothetical protein GH714_042127 [Hevea brasiliensis]|uniref:Bet v I/Major latex protein domain-containing protein n=1 Tax=Hevea brasiliensis TaxID=3981 RepID=A0A6A6MWR2_HEVBR|nr:hypothetical protein GH714_042127 [Hevea brasiliensis]
MDGETSFSAIAPSVFDGENYQVWAVMMEAYMDPCERWENIFASNIPVVKEVEAIMDPTTFTVLQFAVSTTSIHTICIVSTRGWSGGIQSCDPSSWTRKMVWHWLVTFPWISAHYAVLNWVMPMKRDYFRNLTSFKEGKKRNHNANLRRLAYGLNYHFSDANNKVPNHTPTNIQGVDVHEGDWVTSGSIKVWKYTVEGRSEIFKEKIVLDDDKKTVTLIGLEGDLLKIYEVYNVIWQLTPKGQGSLAKLILEYEKLNENVPAPCIYLDFVTRIAKDIDE